MQVGQFPASAANSLIQGYCDDFVSLAAILAQTLEQISMRGLNIDGSRPAMQRIEHGMRNLADAIHELLERGKCTSDLSASLNKDASAPAPAAASKTGNPAANRAATPTPAPNANPPRAAAAAHPTTHSTTHSTAHPTAHPTTHPTAHAAKAPETNASRATPAGPATHRSGQPAAASHPPAPAGSSSPARPAPPKPQSLRGSNLSMPLLSVFQFLGRMRKAGMMRVQLGDEAITFELQSGCIQSTTTSQCPQQERLGELLVELGYCTREAIEAIVNKVDAGASERFGQLAIESGLVTDQQVVAALELQVNCRFDRACKAQTATYEFVEGVRRSAESTFRIQPFAIA